MFFEKELIEAVLIKRYKRFLADVQLPDGEIITIHCPNTGSMKNCQDAGSRVWFTNSDNAKRKYPGTWQLVEVSGRHVVGINTGLANKLVFEAIENGLVAELGSYSSIRAEVPYGEQKSRIDLLLEDPGRCYVEIKNVSLGLGGGLGEFPDAVTTRGQKHLQELIQVRSNGDRAVLFFCVQHAGIERVRPADTIDPEYGRLLRKAVAAGVEVLVYGVDFDINKSSLALSRPLELEL